MPEYKATPEVSKKSTRIKFHPPKSLFTKGRPKVTARTEGQLKGPQKVFHLCARVAF